MGSIETRQRGSSSSASGSEAAPEVSELQPVVPVVRPGPKEGAPSPPSSSSSPPPPFFLQKNPEIRSISDFQKAFECFQAANQTTPRKKYFNQRSAYNEKNPTALQDRFGPSTMLLRAMENVLLHHSHRLSAQQQQQDQKGNSSVENTRVERTCSRGENRKDLKDGKVKHSCKEKEAELQEDSNDSSCKNNKTTSERSSISSMASIVRKVGDWETINSGNKETESDTTLASKVDEFDSNEGDFLTQIKSSTKSNETDDSKEKYDNNIGDCDCEDGDRDGNINDQMDSKHPIERSISASSPLTIPAATIEQINNGQNKNISCKNASVWKKKNSTSIDCDSNSTLQKPIAEVVSSPSPIISQQSPCAVVTEPPKLSRAKPKRQSKPKYFKEEDDEIYISDNNDDDQSYRVDDTNDDTNDSEKNAVDSASTDIKSRRKDTIFGSSLSPPSPQKKDIITPITTSTLFPTSTTLASFSTSLSTSSTAAVARQTQTTLTTPKKYEQSIITEQRNELGGRVRYGSSSKKTHSSRKRRKQRVYGGNKRRHSKISSWEERLNQLITKDDSDDDEKEQANSSQSKAISSCSNMKNKEKDKDKEDSDIFLDDFAFHSQSSQPPGF